MIDTYRRESVTACSFRFPKVSGVRKCVISDAANFPCGTAFSDVFRWHV